MYLFTHAVYYGQLSSMFPAVFLTLCPCIPVVSFMEIVTAGAILNPVLRAGCTPDPCDRE